MTYFSFNWDSARASQRSIKQYGNQAMRGEHFDRISVIKVMSYTMPTYVYIAELEA